MNPIHDYAVCPTGDPHGYGYCGQVHGQIVQGDGSVLCWCAKHHRQWVQKSKATEHRVTVHAPGRSEATG